MKRKELIKLLEKQGFFIKRVSKHIIMSNGLKTIAVPNHNEIKSWTLNEIRKHAGVSL